MKLVPSCVATTAFAALFLVPFVSAQEQPGPEKSRARSAHIEVIRLQYAVSDEVVQLLSQTLPMAFQRGTRVVGDSRTNSLVVTGEEADLNDVKSLVVMLDVPVTQGKPAPARRSVAFEVVLFMLAPGADEALKLPRTPAGVIDASDPEAVLAKLREGVGKAGVSEIAKLSLMADDRKPWKSRQAVQIPIMTDARGGPSFAGYHEAVLDFGVSPESAIAGARRVSISCRIERFADDKEERDTSPRAKQTSNLDFSASAEDGKLVMAAVESTASKFAGSYVLFVRVKG
jgi:hypothetical protein